MVEIRQARYFVAVAEELHFGRAAQRLQMSQPPLSQAIKQLEQQLGCGLLHRNQRSVALSPAGAVFLDHCRALIRHAEEAETAARQAATGRGGRLSLGAVASAFSWPLPLVLERFHEGVPEVEIRTQEIDTHEAAAGLLDRSLDWAIVRQTAPVRGTTATALFADRFVAALPLHHPAADATGPLDLADLAGDPWVWLHRHISPDYHDAMATMCRAAGFSPCPGPLGTVGDLADRHGRVRARRHRRARRSVRVTPRRPFQTAPSRHGDHRTHHHDEIQPRCAGRTPHSHCDATDHDAGTAAARLTSYETPVCRADRADPVAPTPLSRASQPARPASPLLRPALAHDGRDHVVQSVFGHLGRQHAAHRQAGISVRRREDWQSDTFRGPSPRRCPSLISSTSKASHEGPARVPPSPAASSLTRGANLAVRVRLPA